jgi:hypothetical protein
MACQFIVHVYEAESQTLDMYIATEGGKFCEKLIFCPLEALNIQNATPL